MKPSSSGSKGRVVLGDERGAVLVIGLLMSALLLAMIWYIVGIGHMLAYRERAQEAADAVVFSTAVAQARGMNILVLLNLVLSVILSIRVTLRLLSIVLTILSFLPFVGPFAASGRTMVEGALRATTPPMNRALEGLGDLGEELTEKATFLSKLSATFIARGYRPLVEKASVEPLESLPAVPDNTGKTLCGKAVSAMQDMIEELFRLVHIPGIGQLLGGILGLARPLVANEVGALYFCGIGGRLPEMTLPDDVSQKVDEQCKKEVGDGKDFAGGDKTKEGQMDACRKILTGNIEDKANEVAEELADKANDAAGLVTPPSSQVEPNFHNGGAGAQLVATLTLDGKLLAGAGDRGVSIGSFGKATVAPLAAEEQKAVAQAELYYECAGAWESADCNGGGDALWNFRWRARLRQVDVRTPEGAELEKTLGTKVRATWTGPGSAGLTEIPSVVVH